MDDASEIFETGYYGSVPSFMALHPELDKIRSNSRENVGQVTYSFCKAVY